MKEIFLTLPIFVHLLPSALAKLHFLFVPTFGLLHKISLVSPRALALA